MGTDTALVSTMTCVMQPQEDMETWGPLGRGGSLPLCDNSLHPTPWVTQTSRRLRFRTMPASSLRVQGSRGAANRRYRI